MSSNNSSANNMATGEPNKTSGQFHSAKGTVVETIGNLTGATTWQQSGKEEHAQGEAEYNAAQAKGYAEGTIDRAAGKKDAVVGAITGDRSQETQGNLRHDKGQAKQELNQSV
ncbi:hypothetical protein BDZ94DRAFT_1263127 [Collybia nuda]|uniref:CsbD-like domain-containing protein n=1 Tax=Collybia nuda TaxID=64659 RepID=A0A9P6CGX3_9AGAR|nr:hypothetical protein BDZ94DRAFT_1263127 [Collybia nuda]